MANWKLTPINIDGDMFGITPEWTSGSGCYRVKRFSSFFPFVVHTESLTPSAIQLLRWASKLPSESDVFVFMNRGDKVIHLFSAQPFVVEFFRRNWAGTDVAHNLIYLTPDMVTNFGLSTVDCELPDYLSVMNIFKSASLQMSREMTRRNSTYATNMYEFCSRNRTNLSTVVMADQLIASSLEYIPKIRSLHLATNTDNDDCVVGLNTSKTLSASQVSASKAKFKHPKFNNIKQLDLTDTELKTEVSFSMGTLNFSSEGSVRSYNVYEYGVYQLIVIKEADGSSLYLPAKTIKEAKKLIVLFENTQSNLEKRNLCLSFSLGAEEFGKSCLGSFPSKVIDLFNELWCGTSLGYCSFASLRDLQEPLPVMHALEMVCDGTYRAQLKSSSTSVIA